MTVENQTKQLRACHEAELGVCQKYCDIVLALEAENERKTDALVRLQTWAKAYPLEVFPKPDLKKAHKVLKAAGLTLDAISADAMRHGISSIKDIIEQALKENEP